MSNDPRFADPLFLQRTLSGYVQALASLAGTFAAAPGATLRDPASLQSTLAAGYEGFLAAATPPADSLPFTAGAAPAAALPRYQAATARWSGLLAAIAQDAGSRLAKALSESGPGMPPITTLAGLQALWVDCGESAWAEAARRDDFAAAQAELLMASVELWAAAR